MNLKEIRKAFFNGELRGYELEGRIYKEEKDWEKANFFASSLRLEYMEEKTKTKLPYIRKGYFPTSSSEKLTTGIEQKIGGALIPLGFAGPMRINGEHAKGDFFIPVATNEAALIAGLNRGIGIINKSGGVKIVVTKDGMARAPVLELQSIGKARDLVREIEEKGSLYKEMKKAAEKESTVSSLIDIQSFQMGRRVWLRHVYTTGDSMGMNSATRYTANSIKRLMELKQCIRLIALSGNLCSDKKSAHINILLGRGKSVEAEAFIPNKLLKETFGVSASSISKVCYVKNYQGSALSGTLSGFNSNAANTIAGIFAACGQDLAQVVESSSVFTSAEETKDGLLLNISLPSLEVGTVGGGMGFGTARECLSILGCTKKRSPGVNAKMFAEIIGGAVAAQELNLLATLASEYELASSHIRLARGK